MSTDEVHEWIGLIMGLVGFLWWFFWWIGEKRAKYYKDKLDDMNRGFRD